MSSSSLCPPTPPARAEQALPRADAVPPRVAVRRRDRWGRTRRWPFGPVPTVISVVLHAAALAGIVWALAAPPEPEGIGAQVYAVLTPDLGELAPCTPPELPEELPEIECLDVPTLEIEEALEEEPLLEPLEAVDVRHEASSLSLAIVSKRTRPEPTKAEPEATPPPVRVTVPRPAAPPPRAKPTPRPRGAMPRGRLRPIAKPIRYPESARQAGIQGRARVAMTIDPRGAVVDVQLLASSGHGVLDQAALASARRWRFAPPGEVRRAAQTFRFSLN